jgi:quercetin dioxygenase-like cupin family protein
MLGKVTASIVGAMTVLAVLGAPLGSAQEIATPEPSPATLPSETIVSAADISPGAPHLQTIAQGIVTIDGPITWRVRELTVGSTGAPEMAENAFSLQRSGASIIRNELTSRRVRLDAGEAVFVPAGEPFLRYSVGVVPSVVWSIELLPQAAVGSTPATGTTIFTSDAINDYPRGSFEAELSRNVLMPGEVVVLPAFTGPVLVMVTSGQVEATVDGGQVAQMQGGDSRLVTGNVSFRNTSSQPAVVVVAGLGEPVDGVEAGAASAQQPPATTALPTVPADLPPIATVPAQAPAVPEVVPTPVPEVVSVPTPPAAQDPATTDTDSDFIADIDEINIYNTDPNAWDTDGDGLGDGEEVFGFGTDPLSWDTDGDGVSDGDEVNVYGTNPLDPASGP